MTHAEIIERQRRDRAFTATPLGAAFIRFKNAYSRAWQIDTQAGYAQNVSDKRLRELWDAADKAEAELRVLLEPLALASDEREHKGEPHA